MFLNSAFWNYHPSIDIFIKVSESSCKGYRAIYLDIMYRTRSARGPAPHWSPTWNIVSSCRSHTWRGVLTRGAAAVMRSRQHHSVWSKVLGQRRQDSRRWQSLPVQASPSGGFPHSRPSLLKLPLSGPCSVFKKDHLFSVSLISSFCLWVCGRPA